MDEIRIQQYQDSLESKYRILSQKEQVLKKWKFFLQLRQAALQEQAEQHKARIQEKHRRRMEKEDQEEERDGGSGEDVVPGDSVSNQGEVVPEEGTDDQKLKRLSTAERKVDNHQRV